MNDDEIIAVLQSRRTQLTPVEMAELLDKLTGGGLSQGAIVTYFKRAFPDIPLRVLVEAGGWTRVGEGRGDYTDEGFNELLRPWLEKSAEARHEDG